MKKENEIIKKYKLLVEDLKKHNNHYYNNDKPIITDAKFDKLKNDIIALEKKYSFIKKKI